MLRLLSTRRRANATIEVFFALMALLPVTFGAVEFGYFFYVKHMVQNAAREGARASILTTASNAGRDQAITWAMTAGRLQNSGYIVTTTNGPSGSSIANVATVARGQSITVSVSFNFGNLGVRPLGIIAANKQVVGSTTMVKE